MEIWFKRILERRDVPMESEEGHLVTAVPEDLFSLIKTQAELAAEHLKDKALCGAIRVGVGSEVKSRFARHRCTCTRSSTRR